MLIILPLLNQSFSNYSSERSISDYINSSSATDAFQNNGFLYPRPLVSLMGKPLVNWILESLIDDNSMNPMNPMVNMGMGMGMNRMGAMGMGSMMGHQNMNQFMNPHMGGQSMGYMNQQMGTMGGHCGPMGHFSAVSSGVLRAVLIPYDDSLKKYFFEERLRNDFPMIHFVFCPMTMSTVTTEVEGIKAVLDLYAAQVGGSTQYMGSNSGPAKTIQEQQQGANKVQVMSINAVMSNQYVNMNMNSMNMAAALQQQVQLQHQRFQDCPLLILSSDCVQVREVVSAFIAMQFMAQQQVQMQNQMSMNMTMGGGGALNNNTNCVFLEATNDESEGNNATVNNFNHSSSGTSNRILVDVRKNDQRVVNVYTQNESKQMRKNTSDGNAISDTNTSTYVASNFLGLRSWIEFRKACHNTTSNVNQQSNNSTHLGIHLVVKQMLMGPTGASQSAASPGIQNVNNMGPMSPMVLQNNFINSSNQYGLGLGLGHQLMNTGTVHNQLSSNFPLVFLAKDLPYESRSRIRSPLDLRIFYNNIPRISFHNFSMVTKPKRFCFELDRVLVTYPEIHNDYTTVKPIHKNIQLLGYLKKFGNEIIIHTNRGMLETGNNQGKATAQHASLVFETLEKFQIPYDEVFFGKPYADLYIDERSVSNTTADLEKILGFYNSSVAARDFNSIESSTISLFTKRVKDDEEEGEENNNNRETSNRKVDTNTGKDNQDGKKKSSNTGSSTSETGGTPSQDGGPGGPNSNNDKTNIKKPTGPLSAAAAAKNARKGANDLHGEIHWYLNIPRQVKDMFPIMFRHDEENYKWYSMEKLQGIPLSRLYVAGELSEVQLKSIMTCLRRIHSSTVPDCEVQDYRSSLQKIQKEIEVKKDDHNGDKSCTVIDTNKLLSHDIYANYSKKLKSRYLNHISEFQRLGREAGVDVESLYHEILEFFENVYEVQQYSNYNNINNKNTISNSDQESQSTLYRRKRHISDSPFGMFGENQVDRPTGPISNHNLSGNLSLKQLQMSQLNQNSNLPHTNSQSQGHVSPLGSGSARSLPKIQNPIQNQSSNTNLSPSDQEGGAGQGELQGSGQTVANLRDVKSQKSNKSLQNYNMNQNQQNQNQIQNISGAQSGQQQNMNNNITNQESLNVDDPNDQSNLPFSVIHGDPVFTNIILNSLGKAKFIDMRGKLGSKVSMVGDWLYDYSKVYQSLYGYDAILVGNDTNKTAFGSLDNRLNNNGNVSSSSLNLVGGGPGGDMNNGNDQLRVNPDGSGKAMDKSISSGNQDKSSGGTVTSGISINNNNTTASTVSVTSQQQPQSVPVNPGPPTTTAPSGLSQMDSFYRREMLKSFEVIFFELGGTLDEFLSVQMICKLLLFSLIPLHGFNTNCIEFLKLCNEIRVDWRRMKRQ